MVGPVGVNMEEIHGHTPDVAAVGAYLLDGMPQ